MKQILAAALVFAASASVTQAATYILDFDADPNNAAEVASLDSTVDQTITSPRTFFDNGVSWAVTASGGSGVALFDTTCTGYTSNCNGDPDLEVFNQNNSDGVSGNVLIQQRSRSNKTPNDDAGTFFLELELLTNVTLEWTGASALDDGYYRFNFGMTQLGDIDNGDGSAFDNTTGSVDFANTMQISQNDVITVFFNRSPNNDGQASGAVDNFRFNVISDPGGNIPPVPVPASLPLLLVGAGALVAMRRRKRA